MNAYSRLLALLLTTLLASACGWQLKGSANLDLVEAVHVSARNPGDALVQTLNRELSSHQIVIADNASQADYSIVILENRSKRRTLSVTGSGTAAEFLLTEEVDFLLLDHNGQQIGSKRTLSTERTFDHNENQPLAKTREENELKQQMYQQLSRNILSTLGRSTR